MTKYLVNKRTDLGAGWVALPGQLVEDPDGVGILLSRGFITPAPEGYPGELSRPREARAPLEQAAERETEAPAAPAAASLKDLTYAELQARAKLLGINASQKRAILVRAIPKAEKEAASKQGLNPRELLEAMDEAELVATAREHKVEVTNRDETINEILKAGGWHDLIRSGNGDDPHAEET